MTRTNLQRATYFVGVYVLLAAAIAMPLFALLLLWGRGLSVALLPVAIADVMVLCAFRKIAPPVFLDANRGSVSFRRAVFAGTIILALGAAVFADFHPPAGR